MCWIKEKQPVLSPDSETLVHCCCCFSAYRLLTSVRHWAGTSRLVRSREAETDRELTLTAFLRDDLDHNSTTSLSVCVSRLDNYSYREWWSLTK